MGMCSGHMKWLISSRYEEGMGKTHMKSLNGLAKEKFLPWPEGPSSNYSLGCKEVLCEKGAQRWDGLTPSV